MNLQQIRYRVEQLKGQRDQLSKTIDSSVSSIKKLEEDIVYAEEAQTIIRTVAQETQRELEYHINEITSLALSAVFDDPYQLVLEFVQRRNKVEADLWFVRDGEKISPLDAAGGGAVDVAAFALRVAMWSLRHPHSRNVLILDEPLRFLSRDLMPKAALMLSEVSRRLNLQIIMVSHSPELIEGADKYFEVTLEKGVSHVTESQARLTTCERPAAGGSDSGDKSKEQRALDGHNPSGPARSSRRGSSVVQRDNGERSTSKQTHTETRSRRRT